MAINTKIEWCDHTINPFIGCSKCSIGCQSCFAERFAYRLSKNPKTAAKYAGVVDDNGNWTGHISSLDLSCFDKLPKKPSRVFVGSMTDLFHENAMKMEDGFYLYKIFDYMLYHYPQHTYILLTKRPEKIGKWKDENYNRFGEPLPNIWFGVTVCNQEEADKKIPILLQIPAIKHFISVEPMLGSVDIMPYLQGNNKLSWVICGGETGKNARPMHEKWVKNLRDQCLKTGTPYFFKSWGEWRPYSIIFGCGYELRCIDGVSMAKIGKKDTGHLIEGVEYRQFPE